MNISDLFAPDTPLGYPAPYGFLVFFKVLGFALHMVPMNLWYAGLPVMLLLAWRGGEHGRRLSARVLNIMPVAVAYGVNLGIVPLLFAQVAYYKVFYPATILMAWPWFSVIPLLTVAYYGLYLYVIGLRHGSMRPWHRAGGWVSALLFMALGFIFANNFTLMVNLDAWPALWEATSVAGAPTGTALNTGDAALWPRWLMMFGLALTTAAAYVAFDTGLLAQGESEDYRRWARSLALRLYTLGLLWFAGAGTWYFFGALPEPVRAQQLAGPWLALTALTALAPGLPWLLLVLWRGGLTRGRAVLVALAQFGVIALNAISRQVVQNAEIAPYLDVTAETVNMQWSPLILFLVLFVAGLGVLVWMIAQVAKAQPAYN